MSPFSAPVSSHNSTRPVMAVRTAVRAVLRRRLVATVVLSAVSFLETHAALAQELEEIVVSATRRDTTTQDIPYSISVIGGQALQDNNVSSISDLTQNIPGASFVDQGPLSQSNIVLRGINANGTDHPSTNTVAPVSTYIGETPLFIPLQIDDLERVEVLRGPQGTLYGSGSLAGTIRFIPKAPDLAGFSGTVGGDVAQVEVGHDFNAKANAAFNIPLASMVAVRISGGYEHWAGFINERYIVKTGAPSTATNSPVGVPVSADGSLLGPLVFSPIRNANTTNQSHGRVELLFKPNESFHALLTYYHQVDDGNGVQAHSPNFSGNIDTPPAGNPYYSPAYPVSYPTGGVVFPQNRNYDANDSFLLRTKGHTDLYAVDGTYDFGFASLSSDTSYYRTAANGVADGTGLLSLYPSYYGFVPRMVDYQTTFAQNTGLIEELRLVSKPAKYVDYVLGGFYQHLVSHNGNMQWVPGQTYFGSLVGLPGANADTLGDVNANIHTEAYFYDKAVFGELTGHLTDRWDVTGGIRQFWQQYAINSYVAYPYCGAGCGNDGTSSGATIVTKGYSVSNHIFKLNTAYKISSHLNTYATYSEGFRRGGSNGVPISGPFAANPALLIYTPDQTRNFEIGAKGNVAGIRFSGALFYINWRNFQVDATAKASGEPLAVNGPKATSKGVELELSGLIAPGLSYDLGYSYADARVAQDFAVIDFNQAHAPVAIVTGRKGDPLPNAPKSSFTGSLDYTHPAPGLDGWDLHGHLNWSYRSSTLSQLVSTDPQAPPPFEIEGFWVVNASVGLLDRGRLNTALYCDNIFNTLGMTGGADAGAVGPRAAHYFIGRPRTVGIKASYSF